MPPNPDPLAWKEDAFQHCWSDLYIYAFPPFALRMDPIEKNAFSELLHDPGSSTLATKSVSYIIWLFWWKNLLNHPHLSTASVSKGWGVERDV